MILRRYMTRQVASNTALVLGFLLVLLLGGRMIRYFGIAAEGKLDVGLLFAIVGFNLPYFLELLLPLSFFIALMLVFGRLYVDHEMAVLNGSGISRGRLARLITPLILALFVLEAGVSLVGKPWGVRQSDDIWASQAMSQAFDLLEPNSFISSENYHLYVGSISDNRTELRDVILVQSGKDDSSNESNIAQNGVSDTQLVTKKHTAKDTIVLAKRAVQVFAEDETQRLEPNKTEVERTQLDLYQGRRYEIGADNLVYNKISFERYRISIDTPSKAQATDTNIEALPLTKLWQMATSLSADSATNDRLLPAQAELGYRLALPWLIILAPMLAVPLAQVRPRQGRWLRLLPAILIFTSVALVIISLRTAVAKGNAPIWSYGLAIVAFVMFALYLNWASRIHHRVRFRLRQQGIKAGKAGGEKQ